MFRYAGIFAMMHILCTDGYRMDNPITQSGPIMQNVSYPSYSASDKTLFEELKEALHGFNPIITGGSPASFTALARAARGKNLPTEIVNNIENYSEKSEHSKTEIASLKETVQRLLDLIKE